MIRPLFSLSLVVGVFFSGMHGGSLYANGSPSKMHEMQQNHPDTLPKDQKVVLYRLSPKYQRIFLHVLTEDEREEVAVMYHHGDNPYRVINSILSKERKKGRREYKEHISKRKEASVYHEELDNDENEYTFDEEAAKEKPIQKKPVKRSYRCYYPKTTERVYQKSHPKGVVDGTSYGCMPRSKKKAPRFTTKSKKSRKTKCSAPKKVKKYKYVERSRRNCNCCSP